MVGRDITGCCLLLTLCLRGVLAGDWSVHLPASPICAVSGSSVDLPCSYDFPQSFNETSQPAQGADEVLSEMWCLEDSRCITQRYIYHSDGIFPDPSYQNRVEYLGRPGTKNCSLRISDLRPSDSGAYVFYLITKHPTQKMPEQRGVQLLVAESSDAVAVSGPSHDITEGGSLHLACCRPSASPQTRFQWFKSTISKQKHSGQVWSISDITSEASGSYYCQVQSEDKEQNSTKLHIDVQYSPRDTFVSVSPAGDLENERPWTLSCSSDANPPVHTFSWYTGAACSPTQDKSSQRVTQTPGLLSGERRTLSSSNFTAEEAGLYCCVASNRHGSEGFSVSVSDFSTTRCLAGDGLSLALLFGFLLAILFIIAAALVCVIIRRRKSSRSHSYVLTETNATAP